MDEQTRMNDCLNSVLQRHIALSIHVAFALSLSHTKHIVILITDTKFGEVRARFVHTLPSRPPDGVA